TTALKRPAMAQAAGRVYKELYLRQYDHFRSMAQLFYASNQTVESYFWEARHLLGLEEQTTPRQAFIQAVAGQSPLGYERAVLELIDGRTPTSALIARLAAGQDAAQSEQITRNALASLAILYVDGTVELTT